MDLSQIALLAGAGFLAGILNSVLGGGTFISFPALIFAGTPALVANATNALALWPAGLAAAVGYSGAVDVKTRSTIALVIASALGAIVGALLLLLTPEARFVAIVPWLLLFGTMVFTFGGYAVNRLRAKAWSPSLGASAFVQFLIAVYGGYFGGGMGILMLASFAVLGMDDIHAMNGLRSILAAIINGVAVIAFAIAGKIAWGPALVLAVAASLGGYLGARTARRIDPAHVRKFVLLLAWAMTTYFLLDAYGVV